MPLGEAPYGVADSRPATRVVTNPNNSTQFKKAPVHTADTMSTSNFVITTDQVSKPDSPTPYSKNTMGTIYGSGAQYAVGK
jgi:hypothetical protein